MIRRPPLIPRVQLGREYVIFVARELNLEAVLLDEDSAKLVDFINVYSFVCFELLEAEDALNGRSHVR